MGDAGPRTRLRHFAGAIGGVGTAAMRVTAGLLAPIRLALIARRPAAVLGVLILLFILPLGLLLADGLFRFAVLGLGWLGGLSLAAISVRAGLLERRIAALDSENRAIEDTLARFQDAEEAALLEKVLDRRSITM